MRTFGYASPFHVCYVRLLTEARLALRSAHNFRLFTEVVVDQSAIFMLDTSYLCVLEAALHGSWAHKCPRYRWLTRSRSSNEKYQMPVNKAHDYEAA